MFMTKIIILYGNFKHAHAIANKTHFLTTFERASKVQKTIYIYIYIRRQLIVFISCLWLSFCVCAGCVKDDIELSLMLTAHPNTPNNATHRSRNTAKTCPD